MTRFGKKASYRKYNLRYYAEGFSCSMWSRCSLLHARTLDGAKEEAERRLPLHAPGDMLRVLGVVQAIVYPKNNPVVIAERVFPKGWAESDEAHWFRMVEEEAELIDGVVSQDKKPRIAPDKIKYIADTLGIGENRLAAFVQDYGDVILSIAGIELMTFADAAKYINISKFRLDQLERKGCVGEAVRFSGKRFLRRAGVEAFVERRRLRIAEMWALVERIEREELAARAL